MDSADRLRARLVAVIVVFAALAWPVRAWLGDAGIQVALVLALGAVWTLTVRSLAAAGGDLLEQAPPPHAPSCVSPDGWRSEHWIRNAARQGIEDLEEWRRPPPLC